MTPSDEHLESESSPISDDPTFRDLMCRVRSGSVPSVTELLERCGPHILRIVRRRLNPRMRSRFDSQDFAQAVWVSFFADVPSVSRFDCEEDLVAYLGRIAANKVIDQCRAQLGTRKRRQERDTGLDDVPPAADEATPSQFAMANECWSRLTTDLPARDRAMLELRLTGHTYEEIAAKSGLHERSVRRFLARLERRSAG